MSKYSKALAAILGGCVAMGTALGFDVSVLENPALQASIVTVIGSVVAVVFGPANK